MAKVTQVLVHETTDGLRFDTPEDDEQWQHHLDNNSNVQPGISQPRLTIDSWDGMPVSKDETEAGSYDEPSSYDSSYDE